MPPPSSRRASNEIAKWSELAPGGARDGAAWLDHLPSEWRAMVIAPLDFVEHHDYEIAAGRCLGYDDHGWLCYYAHGYELDASCADDDEAFHQPISYSETVHSWRLNDERWLVHRIVRYGGEGAPGRGDYSFSEICPR